MFLWKLQQKADAVEQGGIQGQVPWPEMQVLGPDTGAVCSGFICCYRVQPDQQTAVCWSELLKVFNYSYCSSPNGEVL